MTHPVTDAFPPRNYGYNGFLKMDNPSKSSPRLRVWPVRPALKAQLAPAGDGQVRVGRVDVVGGGKADGSDVGAKNDAEVVSAGSEVRANFNFVQLVILYINLLYVN